MPANDGMWVLLFLLLEAGGDGGHRCRILFIIGVYEYSISVTSTGTLVATGCCVFVCCWDCGGLLYGVMYDECKNGAVVRLRFLSHQKRLFL